MNKALNRDSLVYGTALIIMVVMPVYHWYLPPFMILWSVLFLTGAARGITQFRNTDPLHKSLFILFMLFYLWQICGMFYSDNPGEGWRNIELHLSMLIFPLVMLAPGEMLRKKVALLLKVFTLSTFAFLLFCFAYALYRSLSISNGGLVFNPYLPDYTWLNYFFGSEFAVFQHTSYLSMFTLLSVFIALESFFDPLLTKKRRYVWLIIGMILFISIYFLSSRAGILATILTIPLYLFIKLRKLGMSRFAVSVMIVFILVLIPLSMTNPRVNNYLKWRIEKDETQFKVPEDRIIIWNAAKEILKKNYLMGVGTGDIQSELNREYHRTGNKKLAEVNTNAHNQYFEIIAENGIPGLLLFLAIMGTMIWLAIRQKNLIYLMFIIMVFSSFMFETMLNRLAGVSFFSLFSFILMFLNKSGLNSKKNILASEDK